jgi:hypothetical protein
MIEGCTEVFFKASYWDVHFSDDDIFFGVNIVN